MQFRRRREKRTDYRKRLALLSARKPRLVIRRALGAIRVQIVEYAPDGDKTLFEVSSKHLRKYGWRGHCGNIPAAYLTGLLIASKARGKIKSVVPDAGFHTGETVFAAILGAKQGGLELNFGASLREERVSGKHVAEYAAKIAGSNEYKKQFSAYLKSGLKPEELPQHFDDVKKKILEEFPRNKVSLTASGETESAAEDAEDESEGWEDVE